MKFYLKSVGKIKSAELNITPLTIFIGANDAGKTYATSSIWALCNYINKDFEFNRTNLALVNEFIEQRFFEIVNDGNFYSEARVPDTLASTLTEDIKSSLKKNTPSILNDTFRFDGFGKSEIGSNSDLTYIDLKIEAVEDINSTLSKLETKFESEAMFEIWVTVTATSMDGKSCTQKMSFPSVPLNNKILESSKKTESKSLRLNRDIRIFQIIRRQIIKSITGFLYFGISWPTFDDDIVYIPAARTGIMLALNYFVKGTILENNYLNTKLFDSLKVHRNRYESSDTFTKPLKNFAESVQISYYENNNKLGGFLNSLLPGKIKRQQRDSYHFIPNGLSTPIPLAASSSLVTELAPISILENRIKMGSVLILEEPEAHLHLAAQREMAKTIVRMVNKGCKILITTHSDTFLQQLNNLILLNDLDNKDELLKEFDLCDEDTISKDLVSAYEFNCNGNDTSVIEMKFDKYGFVAKSLNEVLENLSNQTSKILYSISESLD